jgi:DeoR/GlpR family transcriptional regulator of sugar metabolism
MLAEERRKKILSRLSQEGQLLSTALVKEFTVSEDTIRRDLKELADAGLLKKVHGGAMPMTTVPYEYGARQELNIEEKSAMARRAVSLIRNGMLIFVDGGTTVVQLAQHLPADFQGTFVTHSLPTATALAAMHRSQVILLGGKIIPNLLITTGPAQIDQAKQFRPDLAVVGVHGLTPQAGATVESYDDASIKRVFIQNSAEIVVLAGHEKIGFVAAYTVAATSDISYLISDANEERLQPFAEEGITVWGV